MADSAIGTRAADMPGTDDLMMRVYAAMTQHERTLIGEPTRTALAAARARGVALGSDRVRAGPRRHRTPARRRDARRTAWRSRPSACGPRASSRMRRLRER